MNAHRYLPFANPNLNWENSLKDDSNLCQLLTNEESELIMGGLSSHVSLSVSTNGSVSVSTDSGQLCNDNSCVPLSTGPFGVSIKCENGTCVQTPLNEPPDISFPDISLRQINLREKLITSFPDFAKLL
ncbi:MAG: hypothetical protein F6K36_09570 [Symploca sp. SIO3C6]|nr:hypothetical protein [Symploca sp. SIO3C6]